MLALILSSSSPTFCLRSKTLAQTRALSSITTTTTMSINLQSHAFAGNPLRSRIPNDPLSPISAFESLKTRLLEDTHQPASPDFKVLPFRKGRPLASSSPGGGPAPDWHLGWISLADLQGLLASSGVQLSEDSLVYLGSRAEDDVVYWAIDVSDEGGLVPELSSKQFCFVELRTLMVATDWADERAMGDLAIAGHARALLEWHSISCFCGHCGGKTVPAEAGRRKQCSNDVCKKRFYPRVDPVVIMLVIDRENDRALLSRQSRFVPRMWSCLAGFIEPGESLEEAVRRETYEETGIEVGEVIYHSSQPWPVGSNSMPCQLMIGFFAYAKSFGINVDKEELEGRLTSRTKIGIRLSILIVKVMFASLDAQWHSREDIRKALAFAEYEKAQRTAAAKVEQMCRGVQKGQNLAADFNVESGELASMFVPGPFAIAHHLISSWVDQGLPIGTEAQLKQPSSSLSNL